MKNPFLFLVFVSVFTLNLNAMSLIHFDGTQISGINSNIRTPDVSDSFNLQYNFGTDNSSKMFNTGNSQLDFYGGYSYSAAGGTSVVIGDPQLRESVGGHYSFSGASGAAHSMHVLYMWKQDQFLNGRDVGTVQFDADSTMSIEIGEWRDAPDARFVVREGTQYYISEAVHSAQNSTFSLMDFNNNSTVGYRWGLYTPTATDFNIPDVLPTFLAVDFQNITEVGFVIEGGRNNYHGSHNFTDFEVTVIPEPSSVFLLGITALISVVTFRRKD
ncbi:PEP-CTERM sorting domain-containing protein [Kiritimatiellaeota bacterium B1221]|nr:PEP-CTERM sorting domain-containing protein [Kiritimatiellaeota bacterium B1221]